MSNKFRFSKIKVLKEGVKISFFPIDLKGGGQLKAIELPFKRRPATIEMQDALQAFAPDIADRFFDLEKIYNFIEEEQKQEIFDHFYDLITIQGITIDYNKQGFMGLKVHFKLTTKFYNSPWNTTAPFLYEYQGEDFEALEPDDQKPYLTDEMIENLKALCKATEEYLKIEPAEGQLSLFGTSNVIGHIEEIEVQNERND